MHTPHDKSSGQPIHHDTVPPEHLWNPPAKRCMSSIIQRLSMCAHMQVQARPTAHWPSATHLIADDLDQLMIPQCQALLPAQSSRVLHRDCDVYIIQSHGHTNV